MAKKKRRGANGQRQGGKHQSARRTVALPLEWFKVADGLAKQTPTPTVWWLISVIKEKAEAAGMTGLPPTPWGAEKKDTDRK